MAGVMAYARTIRELGSAAAASTGYGEASHKAVKPCINKTNRHHSTFLGQVPLHPHSGQCRPLSYRRADYDACAIDAQRDDRVHDCMSACKCAVT